jgi:hypothetical protein
VSEPRKDLKALFDALAPVEIEATPVTLRCGFSDGNGKPCRTVKGAGVTTGVDPQVVGDSGVTKITINGAESLTMECKRHGTVGVTQREVIAALRRRLEKPRAKPLVVTMTKHLPGFPSFGGS